MPELAKFLIDAKQKGLTITNVTLERGNGERATVKRDKGCRGRLR